MSPSNSSNISWLTYAVSKFVPKSLVTSSVKLGNGLFKLFKNSCVSVERVPSHNSFIPVQQEVRRSKRTIQKPSRFRDENCVSSPRGSSTSSEDKRLLKVKRILAETIHNGNTFYLGHIVGEPAQNALWIQDTKIEPKTMNRIKAKPPPLIQ